MEQESKVATSVSREELLERARALAPVLKERAGKTEALRRLPEDTERAFHDSGLFRMVQPARVGGLELDCGILVDAGAEIARGCASSAWNLTNLASHHLMLGMFPKAAQDKIWDQSPDTLIASSFAFPAGRAHRVQDGYLLSGHWPFSSGVDNSDWNMLGAVVDADDEHPKPEHRIFLLPKSDYEILDTWHAMGLSGTGSNDVRTSEIFVPRYRTLAVADVRGGPTPGSEANPGALFRLPVFDVFPYMISGVALGVVQAAWEDYVSASRKRASTYTGARLAELQTIQIKVAETSAWIDTAALIMRSNCAEAMQYAEAGEIPSLETKVRYRRDGAYTVTLCTRAVDTLFAASGAGGLYTRNSLERAFRDAHAVNAHISFNFENVGALYGRVMLGQPVDIPTL